MPQIDNDKLIEILKSLIETMGKLIQILSRPGTTVNERTGLSSRLLTGFPGSGSGAVSNTGVNTRQVAALLSSSTGNVFSSTAEGNSTATIGSFLGSGGDVVAPTSNIQQYLFGDYAANGPTRTSFCPRIGCYWRRIYPVGDARRRLGNWIDANGVQEGSTPFHGTQDYVGSSPASVNAVWSFNVKDIIQKQISSPHQNKGIYVRSNQSWWINFHGRLAANVAYRPKLIVQTEVGGPQTPLCLASACHNVSEAGGRDSVQTIQLASTTSVVFLQFQLNAIVGTTVISATVELTVHSLTTTSRTYGIRMFEADPPLFYVAGSIPGTPQQGYAQNFQYDKDMYGSHPDITFARDFTGSVQGVAMPWKGSPSSENTTRRGNDSQVFDAKAYPENTLPGTMYAEFEYRPETGTTVRKGHCHDWVAEHIYPDSNVGVQTDTQQYPRPLGSPTVTNAHLRYYMRVVDPWDSEHHAGTKWMGFTSRWGYWKGDFWQQVSGNSGDPGDGRLNYEDGIWAFHGNSQRGMQGMARVNKAAGDPHPYDKLLYMGNYLYHLDQAQNYGDNLKWGYSQGQREYEDGITRTGNVDVGPHVSVVYDPVVSPWICVEQELIANTVSGPLDAQNNGSANSDGRMRMWVDGILICQIDGFRITRNPDYGVMGSFFEAYHGGTPNTWYGPWPANYYLDGVVFSKNGLYIGPRGEGVTQPAWSVDMATDEFRNISSSITQSFNSIVSPWQAFYSRKILRDFSGGVYNPYWGALGATVLHGGGHSSSNDNSVYLFDFNDLKFKRVSQHSHGTDAYVDVPGGMTDISRHVTDVYGQYLSGLPSAPHSYDCLTILPPANGGATYGSLIRPLCSVGGFTGGYPPPDGSTHNTTYAQTFGFASLTQTSGTWVRSSNHLNSFSVSPGSTAAYDPVRNRVWWITTPGGPISTMRWLDVATQTQNSIAITGQHGAIHFDTPSMRYDPAHDILILIGPPSSGSGLPNNHRVFYLSCANPAAGWIQATLSQSIPSTTSRHCFAFDLCTDTGKWYGITASNKNVVYEIVIPTPVSGTWTVTPRTVSGSTNWAQTMYIISKRWSYMPAIKRFSWVADIDTVGDVVYAYKPPGV